MPRAMSLDWESRATMTPQVWPSKPKSSRS